MIHKLTFRACLFFFSSFLLCPNDPDSLLKEGPVGMTVSQFTTQTSVKGKIILVNFKADWCVICKRQKPILDAIKVEHKDLLTILIIDMADNPLIAEYFEVDGLSITLLYKNGNMVWDHMGLLQKNDILEVVKALE